MNDPHLTLKGVHKAWRWCKYGAALTLMLISVKCEELADKIWPGFDNP